MGSHQIEQVDVLLVGAGFASFTLSNRYVITLNMNNEHFANFGASVFENWAIMFAFLKKELPVAAFGTGTAIQAPVWTPTLPSTSFSIKSCGKILPLRSA